MNRTLAPIQKTLFFLLVSVWLVSCNSEQDLEHKKLEHIRTVIRKTGFIELPFVFNASIDSSLKTKYIVHFSGNDSLIFERDIHSVFGFLPDTSNFYAFLFPTIGDALNPTIMTLDKKGNKIDRMIICSPECTIQIAVEKSNCYDSLWIDKDLKIRSISKIFGIVVTEDSIPKVLELCNMKSSEGLVSNTGKIMLKDSAFACGGRMIEVADTKFAYDPFGFDLTPQNLSRLGTFSFTRDASPFDSGNDEVYQDSQAHQDSIVTYKAKDLSISFYASPGKILLYSASIETSSVRLAKGIRVGQQKSDVIALFGIGSLEEDQLVVSDHFAGFVSHKLIFKNNRLERIESQARID